MQNQVFTGPPTARRFALCPSTVLAGDPVLLGSEPAVALDNYSSLTLGTTFLVTGSFTLTVIGQSAESPSVGHKINPGDKIYATGTLDAGTNVTTGLTLDANSSNTFFGVLDPSNAAIGSGVTDANAVVQLTTGA